DEAIEKCEENKERECWVYLEIKTDRYIREDEIKRMKDLKKDILEILPKLNSDVEEESAISIQEKSFEEIFREFYKKEREVEADNEVVDLLLRLLNEEGDDSETN
ncbi:MAG: exonuclease SbcCD subunit D C-terminal domain-containing protein, partial [Clostridium celatum]|nr:exonuclease SbcCD subunit D C-terminal domain-containing protein [Clostridium celatum]